VIGKKKSLQDNPGACYRRELKGKKKERHPCTSGGKGEPVVGEGRKAVYLHRQNGSKGTLFRPGGWRGMAPVIKKKTRLQQAKKLEHPESGKNEPASRREKKKKEYHFPENKIGGGETKWITTEGGGFA